MCVVCGRLDDPPVAPFANVSLCSTGPNHLGALNLVELTAYVGNATTWTLRDGSTLVGTVTGFGTDQGRIVAYVMQAGVSAPVALDDMVRCEIV